MHLHVKQAEQQAEQQQPNLFSLFHMKLVFLSVFWLFLDGIKGDKSRKEQELKPSRFIIPQLMCVGVSQIIMSLCYANRLKLTNRWKQDLLQPAGDKVLKMQKNTPKQTCNHLLFRLFDLHWVEIAPSEAVKSMVCQSLTHFKRLLGLWKSMTDSHFYNLKNSVQTISYYVFIYLQFWKKITIRKWHVVGHVRHKQVCRQHLFPSQLSHLM